MVGLSSVDFTPYKTGNVGVDYITTFDSGEPGLHLMLVAVVYGNEICGAIMLDHFMKNNVLTIAGKLSFAFANPQAYSGFGAVNPWASKYIDEDMNLIWWNDVLNGWKNLLEMRRAHDMRAIIDKVDMFLVLHFTDNANPAMMMAGAHA